MSPAEGIAAILMGRGLLGGMSGWTPYVSKLGTNDNSVAILDQAGRGREVKIGIDYPAVQLIGRGDKAGNSYSVLYAKMEAISLVLHSIDQNPSEWTELVSCLVRGGITPLGNDANDRPQVSLNFNLITAPINSGNRDNY